MTGFRPQSPPGTSGVGCAEAAPAVADAGGGSGADAPSCGMAPDHPSSWSSNPKIVLDLDGTLTIDDPGVAYPDKTPDKTVVAAAAAARRGGMDVVVSTARNMRTHKGAADPLMRCTAPVASDWLVRHGIAVDSLLVGKPWCGPGGYYVDDRNLHPEEFAFRFLSPFSRSGAEASAFLFPADASSCPSFDDASAFDASVLGVSALDSARRDAAVLSRLFRRPPCLILDESSGFVSECDGEGASIGIRAATPEAAAEAAATSAGWSLILDGVPGCAHQISAILLSAFSGALWCDRDGGLPPAGYAVVEFAGGRAPQRRGAFVPAEAVAAALRRHGAAKALRGAIQDVPAKAQILGFATPPRPSGGD